jgi:cell division protein FtsX
MIRHALAEGWILLRHRGGVSVILAFALAIPICLAGLTWSMMRWLGPLVDLAHEANVVAVLLHPHMDDEQRSQWIEDQRRNRKEWRIEVVPPERLSERLTHWFPYLKDLLEEAGPSMLPLLVEITTEDVASLSVLERSPAVIAVGPRSSVNRLLGRLARGMGFLLGGLSGVLLLSAALLAAVWVHLELYRHADEITIMRLVGAAESAIRGPFVVAILVPGLIAGGLAVAGTLMAAAQLSRLTAVLGLPVVHVDLAVLGLQMAVSFLLPFFAAMITLARHAAMDFDNP